MKQALADQDSAEDWGGDVVAYPSAREKTNLDLLLEMILLVATSGNSRPIRRLTSGVVIEARSTRTRCGGKRPGSERHALGRGFIVAGAVHGRVRALVGDRGVIITSRPVDTGRDPGLQDLPQAGDSSVFEDAEIWQVAMPNLRQLCVTSGALRRFEQMRRHVKSCLSF